MAPRRKSDYGAEFPLRKSVPGIVLDYRTLTVFIMHFALLSCIYINRIWISSLDLTFPNPAPSLIRTIFPGPNGAGLERSDCICFVTLINESGVSFPSLAIYV